MTIRLWVSGPSGAGKSYLLERLRGAKRCRTFDLDFVGYRINESDWKEWIIPPRIFPVLAEPEQDIVAAGADSHYDRLHAAAIKAGFRPLILLPSTEIVRLNRLKRGDSTEKVASSEQDVKSWADRAKRHSVQIVESIDDVDSVLLRGKRNEGEGNDRQH